MKTFSCESIVLTDIYTVLTVSQSTVSFTALASTKQLWVLPDQRPVSAWIIDIPSERTALIFGPRTWSSNSSTTPTLIRQFTVSARKQPLPFSNAGTFQLERLVWSWSRPYSGIPEIAVDTRPGSKLTVALKYKPAEHTAEVLVLEVNLESGHSREITRFSGKFYKTQIADDYVCCICWWKDTRLSLLVDHRTEQYQYIAIEECAMTPPWNLHLVPGHIVLINPQLVPISVRNMTYELALTPTALFPVVGGAPISQRVLLVKSLLRRHTYLLQGFDMVSVHQDPHVPNNIRTISTQRLDFSEGQTPACTPVSTLVQSPFIGDLDVGGHRVHHASLAHNGG
ncbi:hypothetical protein B0H14DRAFT_3047006, partial [Mycena olivaceomarginata]